MKGLILSEGLWSIVGIAVTTLGAIVVAWIANKSGRVPNQVAEARIQSGTPEDNQWKSLATQYDLFASQLHDEMRALRLEVKDLRDEQDRERSERGRERREWRNELDELRAYIEALINAWGDPEPPTPTARVRRHLVTRTNIQQETRRDLYD